MKILKILIILGHQAKRLNSLLWLVILVHTFSCTDWERDNIYDLNGVQPNASCYNAVTDAEANTVSCGGQTYKTVKIGEQIWMAENLNYAAKGSKCYGEGAQIYEGWNFEAQENIYKTLTKAEVQANCATYGRLYNWETAIAVCPEGWHLPSEDDWKQLFNYVASFPNTMIDVGMYLKATAGWKNCGPSDSGFSYKCEDSYGFSALPGGFNSMDESAYAAYTHGKKFQGIGDYGLWWSANASAKAKQTLIIRSAQDEASFGDNLNLSALHSVRCIKD